MGHESELRTIGPVVTNSSEAFRDSGPTVS
jgi:hypothetical protein